MPRKNPVTATDIAIGKRLAHRRMEEQFSREELASNSGLSAGIITRVELGRMPLRYVDGKRLLRALSLLETKVWPDIRPINPLWLAEGMEPETVDWPLLLPQTQHLGVSFSASFSHVIQLHRALIIRLVQDPTTVQLPESWLRAYADHWDTLNLKAHVLHHDTAIVERLLRTSAEKLAPASTLARGILDDYHTALAEPLMIPRLWQANRTFSKQVLTAESEKRNVPAMKMRELLRKVRAMTSSKGDKAKLADALSVPLSRVSEWLSGKYEPNGETTLRLLQWVEQQERQQNEGVGSASTPPTPKAQPKESNEKKPRSSS